MYYKYFDIGSLYPYVESFVISPCVPFSCFEFFQRLSEHLVYLPKNLVETCLWLASQSFKWGHVSTINAGSVPIQTPSMLLELFIILFYIYWLYLISVGQILVLHACHNIFVIPKV